MKTNRTSNPINDIELLNALRDLPSGKSPGIDGLPAEFYKVFWTDLKEYYLNAVDHAYNTQCENFEFIQF